MSQNKKKIKDALKDVSEEEFNNEFLKLAFPDWMRSTKESRDFRGYILEKHMILEHLLDLLIIAFFFGRVNTKKSENFRNTITSNMDFGKKVKALTELSIIDKDLKGLIFQVNDYRLAQAHIKRNDPLREPNKENWDKFQKFSTEVHSRLSTMLMKTDKDLKKKVLLLVLKDISQGKLKI